MNLKTVDFFYKNGSQADVAWSGADRVSDDTEWFVITNDRRLIVVGNGAASEFAAVDIAQALNASYGKQQ